MCAAAVRLQNRIARYARSAEKKSDRPDLPEEKKKAQGHGRQAISRFLGKRVEND